LAVQVRRRLLVVMRARSLLRLKNGYVRDDADDGVRDWNTV